MLHLKLSDKADLVDAISEVAKVINSKGKLPVPHYQSFLHMIYNPTLKQLLQKSRIMVYKESGCIVNVRDDPKKESLEGAKGILTPARGCISESEEAIDYNQFLKPK